MKTAAVRASRLLVLALALCPAWAADKGKEKDKKEVGKEACPAKNQWPRFARVRAGWGADPREQ